VAPTLCVLLFLVPNASPAVFADVDGEEFKKPETAAEETAPSEEVEALGSLLC
jgi:hypothetical protein